MNSVINYLPTIQVELSYNNTESNMHKTHKSEDKNSRLVATAISPNRYTCVAETLKSSEMNCFCFFIAL